VSQHDPTIQRAYDTAVAILSEAGHVNGAVLICEVDGDGLIVAFDDDRLPGPIAEVLRQAATKLDGDV
jgi:hypothetical protein